MFKVAIVGKPNVGKTTLFNKLIGSKIAITHNLPGVTRDRKEFDCEVSGIKMRLVDTAGLENSKTANEIEKQMLEQSFYAIDEADLCLFVVDGKNGITNEDIQFTRVLQKKKGNNFIMLINKGENLNPNAIDGEFYKLGIKHFIIISAEHGIGMHDLVMALQEKYQNYVQTYGQIEISMHDKTLQIAVVGRPNAGKSTFINKITKSNRLIATKIAGTTRDTIPVDFIYNNRALKIIDTAGIRKKMSINDDIEEMSVAESFRAIDFAHVVVLLIDATAPFDKQDVSIAARIIEEGRILIIAINKWDLIENNKKDIFIKEVMKWFEQHSRITNYGSFFTLSALSDDDLHTIFDEAIARYEKWQTKIGTHKLNEWLISLKEETRIAPMIGNKRLKLKFINQIHVRPPYFMISSNFTEVPDNYISFLKNKLTESFGFEGIPIRLGFRKAKNPFDKK